MVKKKDGRRGFNTYFQHNYITKYDIFSSENNFTLTCNVKPNVGLLKFTFIFKLHCAHIYMLAAICIQSLTLNTIIIPFILVGSSSILPLHLFPLLCGGDVSCETSTSRPVLRVLPCKFSLPQVVPDAIQPLPLWSSSPSFSRDLHPHHSLAYAFVFSSQYMPIPLQPTLLHFLGYFSHLRRLSNSFIYNSVQLGDSTHPS